MARVGTGHRAGGGRGALIPKARLTKAGYAARAAEKLAKRSLIPSPGSARASRSWQQWLPDTPEVRWLKSASLTETLAGGTGEYSDELRKIAGKRHRAAHAAQQKARGKGPKAKPGKVRVVSHWRGRPRS